MDDSERDEAGETLEEPQNLFAKGTLKFLKEIIMQPLDDDVLDFEAPSCASGASFSL